MKRNLIHAIAVILIASAAFCAGKEAATKPALKFPWAGEKLNQPCGKTELEWICATRSFRPKKALRIYDLWDINAMVVEPSKGGMNITVDLSPHKGSNLAPGKWAGALSNALMYLARDKLKPQFPGIPFDIDYTNMRCKLYVNGKLVATKRQGEERLLVK